MSTAGKLTTAEELAALPDNELYELVEGELVRREMSNFTVEIAAQLLTLLRAHCLRTKAGWALGDGTSYCCFPNDSDQTRRPDVSYFTAKRWSPALLAAAHIDVPPDLVVEVVSPTDNVPQLFDKIAEFFAAGTSEAWIIHPTSRQVDRRHNDGRACWYRVDEMIDAAPLVPGFSFNLADLLVAVTP